MYLLEPRGERRADLRTAHQTGQIAMLAGTKPIPIEKLALSFDRVPEDEETCVQDPGTVEMDDTQEETEEPDEEEIEADEAELAAVRARWQGIAQRRKAG